ncbi:RNA pyrophosphohydrolase [Francisella tularensis]|uniref:RNA pyrophosphohydrolase n=11 Tax=Francisella tularensis TaxID=263 RepID=RPPH_FRATT|nr:RNA pyrophosphohydrolase [Francisella tularensis]A4IWB3.1 RecName: Full=RNA pyrophosphohydrolase; AltName: Full=(Di)nucleoside polyphosphate hydrolase [Francisella tularensis subsp. tularensis WY96-3418]A7NEA4.1 RecName: Full=RNA pyrophosphohydrolase; AltName: Full=(Di)nucleoside polyphosphate hydrolase [Francisella tularensis subsp. holarctica FTNF002-00]Q0BKE0.1 RecName: Full=RNA pyrophosphohydrolase; AltName: Full=(Di)nucleoside polyphosphate hydrolase [Francisella tularensis subsp. holarc
MIDKSGYRANVAIVLLNKQNRVFWGQRRNRTSWQFPQGGVATGETPLQAMYRELHEEIGLRPQDVEVIASTRDWYKYDIPDSLVRTKEPICIGQKQKWFLLKLKSPESYIDLDANDSPEFDNWRWVSYWYPINHVVYFKQEVYRKALTYFKEYIA